MAPLPPSNSASSSDASQGTALRSPGDGMPPTNALARSSARRDQLFSIVVGIVLLGIAIILEPVLATRRKTIVQEPEASLRSLAMNFPRLTLGGFRGLLATYLWYQAENDKDERKWLDLETKYDIIGSIEPYFVTVYIFHSWNQAYNLSAQWHDEDSKYKWVLDGTAYLYKGEEYNPNNPDLMNEEGNLYFLKLGGSFERIFYRAHWRSDIARLYQLNTIDPGDKSDPTEALKLVRSFVLRDEFHATELSNPAKTARGYGIAITDADLFSLRKDGKAPADPMEFRYGLSPFYFAYVEYKRSLANGKPTTIGDNVADAWPAMSLRMWCRDDIYYSQQTMDALFDTGSLQDVLSDKDKLNVKIDEIRQCYRNVDMIAPKAVTAFEQHLGRFPNNENVHRKHINETESYQAIAAAESKLFDALVTWHFADRKVTPEVKAALLDTLSAYDHAIDVTYKWVDKMYPVMGKYVNPDRYDFERYVSALKLRKSGIESMLKATPSEKPDMSFLQEEVVER